MSDDFLLITGPDWIKIPDIVEITTNAGPGVEAFISAASNGLFEDFDITLEDYDNYLPNGYHVIDVRFVTENSAPIAWIKIAPIE